MPKPIISLRELAKIAKDFGPNTAEDVAYLLRRGESQQQGIGKTKPALISLGPYGCRSIYVGNMTVREKMEAGQLATNGDYVLSLPAGTVVYTSDIIRVSANPWLASNRYIVGQKVTPSSLINQVLICVQAGTSAAIEPTWPSVLPETSKVNDGSVVWENTGTGIDFQIIQISGPSTYGDYFSTKMACTLRQEIVKPS